VKTPTQQGWLALHAIREGFVRDRTACVNRVRGVLSEFGIVFPTAAATFRKRMPEILADEQSGLPPIAIDVLTAAWKQFQFIDEQIKWCDVQVQHHVEADLNAQRAMSVCGVGPLSASAIAASLGDMTQFANGRQFSAWVGLTPRMKSSGGTSRLGPITKRGDHYLRKLLISGANSALLGSPTRTDPVSLWALQLRKRAGWRRACVALANKNARMIWSVVSKKSTSAFPRG
jgi:transposase